MGATKTDQNLIISVQHRYVAKHTADEKKDNHQLSGGGSGS